MGRGTEEALRPTAALDTRPSNPYPWGMEVHLSPNLQARLADLASRQGRDTEALAREAIERLVDYEEWFVREVEKGLAQVEQGRLLSHEEVGARMEKLLVEKQSRA